MKRKIAIALMALMLTGCAKVECVKEAKDVSRFVNYNGLPLSERKGVGNHMQDLISRQAAIDALDEQITQCDKALGSFDISMKDEYAVKVERASLKAYRETLNVLPSAQPEIIRCKDCKHWREGTAFSYCDKLYGMGVLDALDYMVAEDDYCSMAERRTE